MLRCLYILLVLGGGLSTSVLRLNAIPVLIIKKTTVLGVGGLEVLLFSSPETFPLAQAPTVATDPPRTGHGFSALKASALGV